jgi:hypothetical protein
LRALGGSGQTTCRGDAEIPNRAATRAVPAFPWIKQAEAMMRGWLMAAMAALAIAMIAPADVRAVPAEHQTTVDDATVGSSRVQEARYVVRCHNVRVLRQTRYGRRWVVVRRCHRHYY